jgi:hypothetical protein
VTRFGDDPRLRSSHLDPHVSCREERIRMLVTHARSLPLV